MLSPRNKGAKKRFREPFGKAGLTVAILALVFAMVGGAWAAAGLNSKQKKEVKSIAKSFQGTGPAGAAGPAGAKGDNGSNGSNGAKGDKGDTGNAGTAGKNGESVKLAAATQCGEVGGTKLSVGAESKEVCNGSPWTAGGTLPSGQTETGTWNILATGAFGFGVIGNISFSLPLKAGATNAAWIFTPVQVENEEFGEEDSGFGPKFVCKVEPGNEECVDTGCRGTAAAPIAPKGVLCVFARFEEMKSAAGELYATEDGEGPLDYSYSPQGTFISGVTSFEPEGFLSAYGTWAVTAS